MSFRAKDLVVSMISKDVKPKSPKDKLKQKFRKLCCPFTPNTEPESSLDSENGISAKGTFKFRSGSSKSVDQGGYLEKYLNWGFETSFSLYLLSALVCYFLVSTVFAFLILASVAKGKTCVEGISIDKTFHGNLAGAFTTSWTTFSTVGYGHTYPHVDKECALANFVTSIESFLGILYAGFCGAILFGKVQCVYSRASVIFSKVCVIRYGAGINEIKDDLDDDLEVITEAELTESLRSTRSLMSPSSLGSPSQTTNFTFDTSTPFPVLLFRIVNEKANRKFGNIVNLNLNVVSVKELSDDMNLENKNVAIRRRFRKLQVTPDSLPIFDRIVYVRHKLNIDSPLLTVQARRLIKRNKGKWPSSMNNAKKIRESIHFAQIIFALDGISNISKTSVYAEKTYTMEELIVGWRFENMTFKTEKGSELPYHVDFDLVDAVSEQTGGGAEELRNSD